MKLRKPRRDVSFPELEVATLERWKKDRTFQKSLARNPTDKRFTFYDGPPFATGLPHYGHLLQGTIKDIIPRFKTMQGFYVERRFGWDCHGLPVEYELEKERGIRSRQEILEMGVDVFNEACRAIVLRHTADWEKTTKRLGRWIDFENDYKTMDRDYMESIWWVVKTLFDKGLLYEGRKAMHICPRCATTLSNFEVAMGYRDRQDPAVYVKFPLTKDPKLSLLAWTTMPWTIPGNTLIAINPLLEYVEAVYEGERYVVARKRLEATFQGQEVEVIRTVPAAQLLGEAYAPPYPLGGLKGTHYEVVAADFVTDEDGTGIAHESPAFGEEDMALALRLGAPLIQHVSMSGNFQDPFPRYHDKTVMEANNDIIHELKEMGRLLRKETVTHSYPHCWRCDTPLLNYATTQWFVDVPKLKSRLVKENQQINWTPEHVRDGRFGQWLEGARDWSISRQRFWGNPVPIWRCGENHLRVIGSLDELEALSGERPDDLHKHFVDKITFPCPECAGEMKRIEDVLDCWFESGSMPYAEAHYPFEHEASFDTQFPADFIAEALDQTRGWFYTLHVLGVALKDSRAFDNVITTGLVLAEDGKKMSKSLKNYPEPEAIFETFGADATRLYLMLSPIVRGDNLRFSEKGVAETQRNFLSTLWNVYSFLATYAAVEGWEVAPAPAKPRHVLDRWISSRTDSLVTELTDSLESFDLMTAARALNGFLDELSNWYVRRSRRRFWKSVDETATREAFATLHEVLVTFCTLAAPFTPHLTDTLYRELTAEESVHLADWPVAKKRRDPALETTMAAARRIVSLGLAARSKAKVKLRQPLAEAVVATEPAITEEAIIGIIAEELNVKRVSFTNSSAGFVTPVAQPNPQVIGPLAGRQAQRVIAAIKSGDYVLKEGSVTVGDLTLPPEAVTFRYDPSDDFVVESSGPLVVGLRTELTDELRREGVAREVIRHFQELRKSSGLSVEDRITAALETDSAELKRATETFGDLISQEILARSLEIGTRLENSESVSVGGHAVTISLQRADEQAT